MSLFNRIFGKNGKDKPPTPHEAIQRIREVEELLEKKSQFLEKKINDELITAKKHGTKNKRSTIL
jgi:charged multivesicular body protein 4